MCLRKSACISHHKQTKKSEVREAIDYKTNDQIAQKFETELTCLDSLRSNRWVQNERFWDAGGGGEDAAVVVVVKIVNF